MKNSVDTVLNLLIYALIIITIIYTYKSFSSLSSIEYSELSKDEIHDLLLRNNIKIPNCESISKVTMKKIIPNGYYYTVYYTEKNSNNMQSVSFSRKSESIFRDYILKYGNNISKKYSNVSKILFLVLLFAVILKYLYKKAYSSQWGISFFILISFL